MKITNFNAVELCLKAGLVPFIKGAPGYGKSACVKKIAQKNNMQFFDIRLTDRDASEVNGIPTKENYNNVSVTGYAIPKYAMQANESASVVCFDEFNRAPLEVRNAALKIIHDRMIGDDYKLNENVMLVLLGNLGDADNCEVNELDQSLNNRLVHFIYEPTINDWKQEFADENINGLLVSFIENNPSFFHRMPTENENSPAWASPRTWEHLSKVVGKNENDIEKIKNVCEMVAENIIGGVAAHRLLQWLSEQVQISLPDILKNYPLYKKEVKKLKRDRISQFINELKNIEIEKLDDAEIKNIIAFLGDIDQDETCSFLVDILEKFDAENDKKSMMILKAFPKLKDSLS